MRALLDTNVVLDILLQRETFYNDAVNVFKQITANKLSAYISATTATDIFYFLKKEKTDAVTILKNLLEIVDVLGVDKTIVIAALYSGWADFEDAIQAQVATENKIDLIITRNIKDYQKLKNIKVISPDKLPV